MSIYRMHHLTCDSCEEDFDGMEPTISQLRLQARFAGWRFERAQVARLAGRPARDLCPACATA